MAAANRDIWGNESFRGQPLCFLADPALAGRLLVGRIADRYDLGPMEVVSHLPAAASLSPAA